MSITLDKKINFYTEILSIIVDVQKFDATAFGKWIKEIRENLRPKMSVTDLAEKSGISKQYLSLLERAPDHALTHKPVKPALDKVESLAKALDVDVNLTRVKAGYEPFEIPSVINDCELTALLNDSQNWTVENREQAFLNVKAILKVYQDRDFTLRLMNKTPVRTGQYISPEDEIILEGEADGIIIATDEKQRGKTG